MYFACGWVGDEFDCVSDAVPELAVNLLDWKTMKVLGDVRIELDYYNGVKMYVGCFGGAWGVRNDQLYPIPMCWPWPDIPSAPCFNLDGNPDKVLASFSDKIKELRLYWMIMDDPPKDRTIVETKKLSDLFDVNAYQPYQGYYVYELRGILKGFGGKILRFSTIGKCYMMPYGVGLQHSWSVVYTITVDGKVEIYIPYDEVYFSWAFTLNRIFDEVEILEVE